MDYISLGRRVNKRRRELHMTQEQLAEKLQLSTSFLGHIERGTRKASLETLIALCNALDVSPNYLLERSLTLSNPDMPPMPPERPSTNGFLPTDALSCMPADRADGCLHTPRRERF